MSNTETTPNVPGCLYLRICTQPDGEQARIVRDVALQSLVNLSNAIGIQVEVDDVSAEIAAVRSELRRVRREFAELKQTVDAYTKALQERGE